MVRGTRHQGRCGSCRTPTTPCHVASTSTTLSTADCWRQLRMRWSWWTRIGRSFCSTTIEAGNEVVDEPSSIEHLDARPGPYLRALLHDEAARKGDQPRARHCVRNRPPGRRPYLGLLRARRGFDVQALLSAGRGSRFDRTARRLGDPRG